MKVNIKGLWHWVAIFGKSVFVAKPKWILSSTNLCLTVYDNNLQTKTFEC